MERLHEDNELFTAAMLLTIEEEHKYIKGTDFAKKCTACGGNWTRMFMTGIEELYPKTWAAMPDVNYGFMDIMKILDKLGVDFKEE